MLSDCCLHRLFVGLCQGCAGTFLGLLVLSEECFGVGIALETVLETVGVLKDFVGLCLGRLGAFRTLFGLFEDSRRLCLDCAGVCKCGNKNMVTYPPRARWFWLVGKTLINKKPWKTWEEHGWTSKRCENRFVRKFVLTAPHGGKMTELNGQFVSFNS